MHKSRSSTRYLVVSIFGAVTVGSCAADPVVPEPTIERIEPESVAAGQAVSVIIHGQGFHRQIRSDLGGGPADIEPLTVALDSVILTGVVQISEERIEAEVPATMAAGMYDVVVTLATGRADPLRDGFEVRDGCPGDCPPDACGDDVCAADEDEMSCPQDCCTGECNTCEPGGCCAESCTDDCSTTCDDDCTCAVDCSNNTGACQLACGNDATCHLNCRDASDCQPRCRNATTCYLDCRNASSCQPSCENSADCEIDCTGAVDCSAVVCDNNASCLLNCSGAENCGFATCMSGAPVMCPGDIVVCNRACP